MVEGARLRVTLVGMHSSPGPCGGERAFAQAHLTGSAALDAFVGWLG
jgi:hypothetical protein